MSDSEDELLKEDKDQDQIRSELSQMSFEDLRKLKEKIGSKVYNEALFGPRKTKQTSFKRENKNRPREMSAKKTVSMLKQVIHVKKNIPRDPRFDTLCGTFDEKLFKKSYGFLHDLRKNDLEALKEELKNATEPKAIKKIKYLIQRLENQIREETRKQQKNEEQVEEKKNIVEAIKKGEKPIFKKKSEKRVLNLVSQYEQLKNSGKLKKHIQRLRKKNLRKDREKLEEAENSS